MKHTDLDLLAEVFERARRVVPLVDVVGGDTDRLSIGLRHDVDGNKDSFNNAVQMARWESLNGFRSTYYLLHEAPYWGPRMGDYVKEIASLGHEIGFHNNCLAYAFKQHCDPFDLLELRVSELRKWGGEEVKGTTAHGDKRCRAGNYQNFQLFTEGEAAIVEREYTSPEFGRVHKTPDELGITPRPLSDFGFTYQGDLAITPKHYLTDSGGQWTNYTHRQGVYDLQQVWDQYPFQEQLIVLQHPDWWSWRLFI